MISPASFILLTIHTSIFNSFSPALPIQDLMKGFVIMLLTSVGGWLGWWLGDMVGLFLALVLSMIGTAAGLYFGRRFNQMYD